MTTLLADIGGTYSRFAWQEGDSFSPPVRFANKDFDSFTAVIDLFLKNQNYKPTCFVFAIASDISSDRIFSVNIPWAISQKEIQERYQVPLTFLNDFQAQGLGVLSAQKEYIEKLGGGTAQEKHPICVIGPGTGLGTCVLTHEVDGWKAHPSEAGHTSVNADKDVCAQVIEILQRRFTDVSYERLISGEGILNIYQALCEIQGGFIDPNLTPEQIGLLAQAQEKNALSAYQMMCHFLAVYAGNLALTMKTTGGIYLVGNILSLPIVISALKTQEFRQAFESKGRFIEFMKQIPIYLCTQKNLAFSGLVYYNSSKSSKQG